MKGEPQTALQCNKDSQSWQLLSSYGIWTFIVLPIHIGYRVYLANRMPIMDCDETFNYWEVVHFLLFRDNSFQTWEYANEFSLRTYAYLTPIAGIARVYLEGLRSGIFPSWLWPLLTEQMFDPSQSLNIALFVLLRCTLGGLMAYAEVDFCWSIVEQGFGRKDGDKQEDKVKGGCEGEIKTVVATKKRWYVLVGWVTECLLISSAGMAHSAAALLPSSTLTAMWLLAASAYMKKQHVRFCLFAILATLAIGWPFGVLVLIPPGIGILVEERERLLTFVLLRIIPMTMVIQGLVMFVDFQHYGRIVSPLWNILLYNTQVGGDELYGVEPLSYYAKNLLLNLNYVAPVGLAGIFPLIWSLFRSRSLSLTWIAGLNLMVPLYLWLAVVAPRPHKEERFLYPVYPSFCLGAAIVSVSLIEGIVNIPLWPKSQQQEHNQKRQSTRKIQISAIALAIIWIPACAISLSRTAALSKYYSAPLHVYAQISSAIAEKKKTSTLEETDHTKTSIDVVCTCGEWYRFPSSFFIKSELSEIQFGFAPSTFAGQLPQLFTAEGSGIPKATTNRFNDKNAPEAGSYTPLESCDFLVELSTSLHSCVNQNQDKHDSTSWKPMVEMPFLDAEGTTSTLHRILYIPYLHQHAIETGKVRYSNFALYTKR
ncbi:unnamed protein product [Pseudo-nitzschia multistriata]|uniref:Mannosyltransferase n=1 Tax=Pseudo-nitzschia multistriata TaxID=183589 RepID=A0A448Z427_9STRA|nr:unnamed protein product [Pseudo-nitzschia multistriata]